MSDQKMRLLCVDDEPNVLSGLTRQLRGHYDVVTAASGLEALDTFKKKGPFPIIISDMRMPEMDGAAVLGKIHEMDSDTVRILLTGYADINSAIAAVNEGYIFRFLTKPCPSDVLLKSLQAAENQYRLITAEKVLLEQTLQGSIQTLIDILSLSSPDIFSKVNCMKVYVKELLPHLGIENKWPIEVATMLSQIGAITLPDETVQKIIKRAALQPAEEEMVNRLPIIGEKLLSHIPRLEPVREILLYQEKHFDGSGIPNDSKKGDQIPIGARILKVLLDYEKLEAEGHTMADIFSILVGRMGWYDEKILKTISILRGNTRHEVDVRELPISDLHTGMILMDDVFAQNGICLLRGNVEITEALLARIQNVGKQSGIKEPIRVKSPRSGGSATG